MTSLEHIDITTGKARMSSRAEVDDRVVDQIRVALAADGVLPGGWSVRVKPTPENAGGRVYDLLFRDQFVATCWLCEDRRVAGQIWESALKFHHDPEVRERPRQTPWLASAMFEEDMDIELSEHATLTEWPDLARSVAWALLG